MDRVTPYDEDIDAWSRERAAALRALAATRRDLPNELDLEHVAEEIEDVGKAEICTVGSFIELLLRHLPGCHHRISRKMPISATIAFVSPL